MKALIYILAIVLMAAGLAVGLMSFFSPGKVVLGLNLELAATLLAGGVVTLALAGVMTAVTGLRRPLNRLTKAAAGEAGGGSADGDVATPSDERLAKALAGTAAVAAVAPAAADESAEDGEGVSQAEDETVGAEASAATATAGAREIFVSPRDEVAAKPGDEGDDEGEAVESSAEAAEDEEETEVEEAESGEAEEAVDEAAGDMEGAELYVVEERIIRGRPTRMLSDGTVEAETDEGWMRFENLEHLEEYMEAMSHAR